MTEKILIYRLGSLGDTVVALPALHLIAREYPGAERRVLTNFPVNAKAPAMAAVLGDSGIVDGYFRYPLGARSPLTLLKLRRELATWGPKKCIYLAAPRGRKVALRDATFLRLCGIREIIGLPDKEVLQSYQRVSDSLWESETSRLSRSLAGLGKTRDQSRSSWDLGFSVCERRHAATLLEAWPGRHDFIGFSIGTKADANDWGDPNWQEVLRRVSANRPGMGLVIVGAADERGRSEKLGTSWHGPVLNLCGGASLRATALILADAGLFLGHDSGPMHLAATMDTSCVAVFSARVKPGVWFPHGNRHQVHYYRTDCFDCGLRNCHERKKACILAISPEPVALSALTILADQQKELRMAVS